jgi:hypothetical protein
VRPSRRVRVHGYSLAGLTVARLLVDRGFDVRMDAPGQRRRRILAVPIETLSFAAELFRLDLSALLIGPLVRERIVDWSEGGRAAVPHVAVVCDAHDLAGTLAGPLWDCGVVRDVAEAVDADWTIDASGRPATTDAAGGTRVGYFARIANVAAEASTSITATADGWIFTAPHPVEGVAALLVAPSMARADASPEGIAAWLARTGRQWVPESIVDITRPAPIAPHIGQPLHVDNLLRVGEAALTLDPLRGDGTGFALRGAVLAQAVVAASLNGGDRSACLAHYGKRIRGVFLAHVRNCSEHYRAARHRSIWASDIAVMAALAHRMDVDDSPYEFRLSGLDLTHVDRHATPLSETTSPTPSGGSDGRCSA